MLGSARVNDHDVVMLRPGSLLPILQLVISPFVFHLQVEPLISFLLEWARLRRSCLALVARPGGHVLRCGSWLGGTDLAHVLAPGRLFSFSDQLAVIAAEKVVVLVLQNCLFGV